MLLVNEFEDFEPNNDDFAWAVFEKVQQQNA